MVGLSAFSSSLLRNKRAHARDFRYQALPFFSVKSWVGHGDVNLHDEDCSDMLTFSSAL